MGRLVSTHTMSITMSLPFYERMQEKLKWRFCQESEYIWHRDPGYVYYELCTIDRSKAKFVFASYGRWNEQIHNDFDMLIEEADSPISIRYNGDYMPEHHVYYPDGFVAEFYHYTEAHYWRAQFECCDCDNYFYDEDRDYGPMPPPCKYAAEHPVVLDNRLKLFWCPHGNDEQHLVCRCSFGQKPILETKETGCHLRLYKPQRYQPKRTVASAGFQSKKDGIAPRKLAHYVRAHHNERGAMKND